MAGLHSPETVRRVEDAVRRRYRDSLHLPRMGLATLISGPRAEQSVGLRAGDAGSTSVMTEQAFTLAMGDLRLDVGHEERSAKELPGLAYENERSGLVPIIECFRDPEEFEAGSSSSDGKDAPSASSGGPADNVPASPQGDEDTTGTADQEQEGSSEETSDPAPGSRSEPSPKQASDNASSDNERMLTPDLPIPSEPYDLQDPSCAESTSGLPPGYVKPTLEEGELDESCPELSSDERCCVREVAAKVAKVIYWPVRVRIWQASAESLRTGRIYPPALGRPMPAELGLRSMRSWPCTRRAA
eukprot:6149411-Pleurochrysis_carterae.AAC.1